MKEKKAMNHSTLSEPQAPARGCRTDRQAPGRGLIKFASPVLVVAAIGGILWVSAGDLNPPPGAIQPTNRVQLNAQAITLPFTINQPGSYVLTSNLTGVSGQDGIIIEADDVTLDLNGFALIGVAGSLDGVAVPAARTNLAVRRGTVRDWGGNGVDGANATNSQFEHLRASGNGANGIRVGAGGTVTNCTVRLNGSRGISVSSGSTVTDCTARENGGDGINANSGSTVTNCTAQGNGEDGIDVFNSCTVVNCTAEGNTSDGIEAGEGCTITNCTAANNTFDGITTSIGCTVSGCTVKDNMDDGISVTTGCTLQGCTVYFSGDNGIIVINSCTIQGCTVSFNTGDGIQASGDCRIIGNTCDSNGAGGGDGAGIHTISFDNRIEGNNVTDNDRGIDVDVAGNFIVKNTASGNGNDYVIVNGNDVGTIQVSPVGAGAWDNFRF
ncbi:MAG: right-handed parallel beta-helix repeat-containing protein [Planctomycetes bacterium]|nr:right-handed parallel beta-helix repeat-containing protein [Planctomycetota bacterium]